VLAKPILTPAEAASRLRDGQVVMSGGFMGCGAPHTLIRAIQALGLRDLTLIGTDTGMHDFRTGKVTGVAHLVRDRVFRHIIASHIGLNHETQRQMNAGETRVDLVPQGTLAERIRAGGAGIPAFFTRAMPMLSWITCWLPFLL